MLLFLIGIVVLLTSRLRITPRYGLEGHSARVAGTLFIFFGLVYSVLFHAASAWWMEPNSLDRRSAMLIDFVVLFAVLGLALRHLVRKHGNAYAQPMALEAVSATGA